MVTFSTGPSRESRHPQSLRILAWPPELAGGAELRDLQDVGAAWKKDFLCPAYLDRRDAEAVGQESLQKFRNISLQQLGNSLGDLYLKIASESRLREVVTPIIRSWKEDPLTSKPKFFEGYEVHEVDCRGKSPNTGFVPCVKILATPKEQLLVLKISGLLREADYNPDWKLGRIVVDPSGVPVKAIFTGSNALNPLWAPQLGGWSLDFNGNLNLER